MVKSEKVIIDGIDVSECVFFKERYTRIGDDVDNDISFKNHCMLSECTFSIDNCEKINCYYKQLKRLQEENEELKEENSHKSNLIWYIFHCSKVETVQRLLYEYYECINDDRYNKKRVKKFWDDVFHLQQRKKYKSKYKQALEEIRNYCDEQNLKADYTACYITNRIDEVLNDQN